MDEARAAAAREDARVMKNHRTILASLSLQLEAGFDEYEHLQEQLSPLKRGKSAGALDRLAPSRRSASTGDLGASCRYAGAEMMKGKIPALRAPKPFVKPPAPSATRSEYTFGALVNESPFVKVHFVAGNTGMVVNGSQVISCAAQAWMNGVRPGWTITNVNGTAITQDNDDQVEMLLGKARAAKKAAGYDVIFQKGRAKFGTGASSVSKIQQEIEDNIERVQRTFRFQGNIDKIEQRGITYAQLERVQSYAMEHCANWKDQAPPELSIFSGKPLKMEYFNINHANPWIILPATEKRRCSFVELMSKVKQVPRFCVIHWWTGPMADLMKCLQTHLRLRGMAVDTPYWMSAFALRQHQHAWQDEVCADRRDASFAKALNLCGGQALMVFGMAGKTWNRTWCMYEASMCLGHGMPLDLAVCQQGKPILLTSGLTGPEEKMESTSVGSGIKAKAAREEEFPLSLIQMGLELDIRNSETSDPDDRAIIFNAIAGRSPESEPLEDHPSYEEMNKRLRGYFASHLLPTAALCKDNQTDEMRTLWSQLIFNIQGDVWRKTVRYNLDGMTPEGMELLLQCLPPGMEDCHLRMRGSSILDDDLVALAEKLIEHPRMKDQSVKKRSVNLDLKDSEEVGDGVGDDVWHEAFAKLKELGTAVCLDYTETEVGGHDPLTKAMAGSLAVNPVGPGVQLRLYRRRVMPAVPTLCKILLNEDESIQARKSAARALGGLGQAALEAVPALQKSSVEDPEDAVKAIAAAALALVTGVQPED
mmetsp:Transcript_45619/g.135056  ORF Transcript_45619/g.135056 Transcript_45619/m.135056 type:complete len:763 (-) Transcript_45619:83-2371(-)